MENVDDRVDKKMYQIEFETFFWKLSTIKISFSFQESCRPYAFPHQFHYLLRSHPIKSQTFSWLFWHLATILTATNLLVRPIDIHWKRYFGLKSPQLTLFRKKLANFAFKQNCKHSRKGSSKLTEETICRWTSYTFGSGEVQQVDKWT